MASYIESLPQKKNNRFFNFLKVSGIVFCTILSVIMILVIGLYYFINNVYSDTLYDGTVPIVDRSSTSAGWLPTENDLTPVLVDLRVTKDRTEYGILKSRGIDEQYTDDIKVIGRYLGLNGKIFEEAIEDFSLEFSEDTFITNGKKYLKLTLKKLEYAGLTVNATVSIPITIVDGTPNPNSPFDSDLNKNLVYINYDTSTLYEWAKIYDEETYEKIKTGYLEPIYRVEQKNPDIFNILLITTEKNKIDPNAKRSNINILTLLSYNFKTSEATTVTLDDKLLGTNLGKSYTLNGIWAIGGPGALINTLNTLCGLDIQRYVHLDSTALVDLVDAVGNVPVTMTKEEIELLGFGNVKPGIVYLDHDMADTYITFESPDKVNRQQKFTTAVLKKTFDGLTVLNFSSVVSKINFAKTNISSDMLFNFVFFKGINIDKLQLDKHKAPFGEFGTDYAYVVSKDGNFAMLYTNFDKLKQNVHQIIGYSN